MGPRAGRLPVSRMWQLKASWSRGYWLLAHAGSEEALRKTVYREGLELGQATVARTIIKRLVTEGRAERTR